MSVSLEIFNTTVINGQSQRDCNGRVKVHFEGVFSHCIELRGRSSRECDATFLLTLNCPVCRYWEQKYFTLRKAEVWDEEHRYYTDFLCFEEDIETRECKACWAREYYKCRLPCFDEDCEEHPGADFDVCTGWKLCPSDEESSSDESED